jgi:hypothetical protein
MDKIYLRTVFEEQKPFLKKLHDKENSIKTINTAEDESLNALIQILHLLYLGEIHLSKADQEILIKSKRGKKLQNFQSKQKFIKLLHGPRQNKIVALRQFVSLYPIFLHGFFHSS